MESTLRERLYSTLLAGGLDEINADQRIGPHAPGDGDVLQWLHCLCLLGIAHVFYLTERPERNSTVDKATFLERVMSTEPVGKAGSVMWLEWYWNAIFSACCPSPTIRQQSAWTSIRRLMVKETLSQWGGRKIRLHKRRKVRNRDERIAAELLKRTPIQEIPGIVGVSRATLYRLLKKKNPLRLKLP